MSSLYENCEFFKFDDIILTDISGCVDFISGSFIFHTWRTFKLEKSNDFGQSGSVARLFSRFHAGARKSL